MDFLKYFLRGQVHYYEANIGGQPQCPPLNSPLSRTPGGGFRLQDFGPRGGDSIAGFPDFRARSARNGAERAILETFEDFSKILPN